MLIRAPKNCPNLWICDKILALHIVSVPARPLHSGAMPCPYLTVPCMLYFVLCIYRAPDVIGNYDTVTNSIS